MVSGFFAAHTLRLPRKDDAMTRQQLDRARPCAPAARSTVGRVQASRGGGLLLLLVVHTRLIYIYYATWTCAPRETGRGTVRLGTVEIVRQK